VTVLAMLSGGQMSGGRVGPPAAPSVIVVIGDDFGNDLDTRSGSTSTYASTDMPGLATMAAEGTRFSDAGVNPSCTVTRASLALGQFAFRHGMYGPAGGSGTFPSDPDNHIARMVHDAGGAAVAAGKFGPYNWDADPADYEDYTPIFYGFDYAYVMRGLNPTAYSNWDGFEVTRTGFDAVVGSDYSTPDREWADGDGGQYVDVASTDYLLAKYAARDRSKPFYGQLGLANPHTPWHNPTVPGSTSCSPDPDGDSCRKLQAEMLDSQLQRVLDAADGDNTFVVFITDNGTAGGDFGGEEKGSVAEGGIRVPLYVRGPGVPVAVEAEAVSAADHWATVLDLLGVPVYSGGETVDGYSYAALLGQTCDWTARCFDDRTQGVITSSDGNDENGMQSIRDTLSAYSEYKLQYDANSGVAYLFDLTSYAGWGWQPADLCGGDGDCDGLTGTNKDAYNYLCDLRNDLQAMTLPCVALP